MQWIRRGLVAGMLAGGVVLSGGAVAQADTAPFTSPGTTIWRVPAGVTSISIAAVGAPGGACSQGLGGLGAQVTTGQIAVSAGEVLQVTVGSAGSQCATAEVPGGTLGGGSGGSGALISGTQYYGGAGGGGASLVAASQDTYPAADTLFVVAGAGGGASAESNGGNAGASATAYGSAPDGESPQTGGGGATASAGGAGGTWFDDFTPSGGASGAFEIGGHGQDGGDAPYPGPGGGGGGGGYYGGGGGGGGVGTLGDGVTAGGGGSSYVIGQTTPTVSIAPSGTAPSVTISYKAAAATAVPSSLAFGPTAVGATSQSQVVAIDNSSGGASALQIAGVSVGGSGGDADEFRITSDGCTGRALGISQICDVGVVFAPTRGGEAHAALQIATNAPGSPLTVPLSGAATPAGTSGLSFPVAPGAVFGAGLNSNGQLGTGTTVNSSAILPLAAGSPQSFVSISSGSLFTLGLRPDGTVWSWGQNNAGQLGTGGTTDAHTPQQVIAPAGITAVAAGYQYSLALRSDGTVWAWGDNTDGQLGNGEEGPVSGLNPAVLTPAQVPGLANVVAIAAGRDTSYALKSDGTVWAFGYAHDGALGNGSANDATAPVQVTGLSGVTAISGSEYGGVALLGSGTVWAWGEGTFGELGNGHYTGSAVPVQVSGISTAIAIASGQLHNLAVLANGTVRTWGNGASGQLGTGTATTKVDTPVAVSTPTGFPAHVTAVAAGASSSYALGSTGQVWAWGLAYGNGTTTSSNKPAQLAGVNNGAAAVFSGNESADVLVIGQAYASLTPATGPISFTAPGVGQSSSSLTEKVTDTGIEPLVFGQASVGGADGDEFVITGDGCSGTTIAPGASCTIGLRFNEKVNETAPVATLRIPSNSPTSPNTITLDPPPQAPADAGSPGTGAGSGTGTTTAPVGAGPQPGSPPAAGPALTRRADPLPSCGRAHVAHGWLTVTCAPAGASPQAVRVTLRLLRGGHVLASSQRVVSDRRVVLRIRLPRGLRGRYTLSVVRGNRAGVRTLTLR